MVQLAKGRYFALRFSFAGSLCFPFCGGLVKLAMCGDEFRSSMRLATSQGTKLIERRALSACRLHKLGCERSPPHTQRLGLRLQAAELGFEPGAPCLLSLRPPARIVCNEGGPHPLSKSSADLLACALLTRTRRGALPATAPRIEWQGGQCSTPARCIATQPRKSFARRRLGNCLRCAASASPLRPSHSICHNSGGQEDTFEDTLSRRHGCRNERSPSRKHRNVLLHRERARVCAPH